MSRLQPVAGTEIVDDIRLGHTWYEFLCLVRFINERNQPLFIEVGVHEGGLAHLLLEMFPDIVYVGIELYEYLVRPEVIKQIEDRPYATLWIKDCFTISCPSLRMMGLKKIIYCDGGNKAKELVHFKPACKFGDIIMCHDFWDGIRVPRNVPEGAWKPEVLLSDVEHLDNDPTFKRLDEGYWNETRIAGWVKIEN